MSDEQKTTKSEDSKDPNKKRPHNVEEESASHSGQAPQGWTVNETAQFDSSLENGVENLESLSKKNYRGCRCGRSKCLKQYCQCFRNDAQCTIWCVCMECHNDGYHEETKMNAIRRIRMVYPGAFRGTSLELQEREVETERGSMKTIRGCRCTRSNCVKKYCECYSAGLPCTSDCICVTCENGNKISFQGPPPRKLIQKASPQKANPQKKVVVDRKRRKLEVSAGVQKVSDHEALGSSEDHEEGQHVKRGSTARPTPDHLAQDEEHHEEQGDGGLPHRDALYLLAQVVGSAERRAEQSVVKDESAKFNKDDPSEVDVRDVAGKSSRGCRCGRTRCLKQYCQCFRNNMQCSIWCVCSDCRNDGKHEDDRMKAVKTIRMVYPGAFRGTSLQLQEREVQTERGAVKTVRGCRCFRSRCTKRYCDCFSSGLLCTDDCICVYCENGNDASQLSKVVNGSELVASSVGIA